MTIKEEQSTHFTMVCLRLCLNMVTLLVFWWLFSFVSASFQSIPEQAHNVIPLSTSIDFAGNTNLAIRVSCKHTQCCRNVCVFGRLRLD